MDNTHIIICGLGGQGIILTEKIFSFGLLNAGYDVKVSEIHGLAQRGGSVCAEISYGNKVFSPVIEEGKANIIVSFDYQQTFQYLSKLQYNGKIIVKSSLITTFPSRYKCLNITDSSFDNISLLGILVKELNLQTINWQNAIAHYIEDKYLEKNLKAFNLGLKFNNN